MIWYDMKSPINNFWPWTGDWSIPQLAGCIGRCCCGGCCCGCTLLFTAAVVTANFVSQKQEKKFKIGFHSFHAAELQEDCCESCCSGDEPLLGTKQTWAGWRLEWRSCLESSVLPWHVSQSKICKKKGRIFVFWLSLMIAVCFWAIQHRLVASSTCRRWI